MATGPATLQIPMQVRCFSSRFDNRIPFILQGVIEDERYEMTIDQVNRFLAFSKRYFMLVLVFCLLSITFAMMVPILASHSSSTDDNLDSTMTYIFVFEGLAILMAMALLVFGLVRVKRIEKQINEFLATENETFYHLAGVDISLQRFWWKRWFLQIQMRPVPNLHHHQLQLHQQQYQQQHLQQYQTHPIGYPPATPMMVAMPLRGGDDDGSALTSYPMAVFGSYSSVPTQYYSGQPQQQQQSSQQ